MRSSTASGSASSGLTSNHRIPSALSASSRPMCAGACPERHSVAVTTSETSGISDIDAWRPSARSDSRSVSCRLASPSAGSTRTPASVSAPSMRSRTSGVSEKTLKSSSSVVTRRHVRRWVEPAICSAIWAAVCRSASRCGTPEKLPAGEPAPGGGRDVLVEARLDRGQQRRVLLVAVGVRLLHRGEPLGGHLPRVLGLDLRQPLGALGGLGRVDVDALVRRVLVDLLEQDLDELLLGHLAQRLAAAEDQA